MSFDSLSYTASSEPLSALDIRLIRGANVFAWSPVVRLQLNLGVYDEVFTNTIEGFFEALTAVLPSLYDHHCSVGAPGGFYQRMQEGTLLGHVLEHCALELQVLAGMDVTYGKTRSTAQKGVYNVVFSYFYEEAGMFAAKAALNLINSLLLKEPCDITPLVEHLRAIANQYKPSYWTQSLIAEARRRRIPLVRLDSEQTERFFLGTGKYARQFEHGRVLPTLAAAREQALTEQALIEQALLQAPPIPILEGQILRSLTRTLHLPFSISSKVPSQVLTNTYRILLLNGSAPCALKLAPPVVAGDGSASIEELVQRLNTQRHSSGRLQPITLDKESVEVLSEQGFALDTIVPSGFVARLKREGTLENGGAVIEMTDEVCKENIELFCRIAEFLQENYGLEMAELRITTPSLRIPLVEDSLTVASETQQHETHLQISLVVDMRLYHLPTSGRGYNIAQNLLVALFPQGQAARIPLVAITAGIGGDFLAAMLDDALTDLGYTVGYASTEELRIRKERVGTATSDSTLSALTQTDIDAAVLEIPLETITVSGLRYDRADVGVVLNIDDSALEEKKQYLLETSEDAAHAHALVGEYLTSEGIAVLNANNPIITRSVERYDNEMIYFATHRTNPQLALHCSRGGRALVLDGSTIMLHEGKHESPFVRGVEIETSLDKDLVLALTATLLAFGIPKHKVKDWLEKTIARLSAANVV